MKRFLLRSFIVIFFLCLMGIQGKAEEHIVPEGYGTQDFPVLLQHYSRMYTANKNYLMKEYGVENVKLLFDKELASMKEHNYKNCRYPVLEKKTIKRRPDVSRLKGKDIQDFIGENIESMRVYSYRFEKFIPIPYQFDEMHSANSYCLPHGKHPIQDQSRGVLDENDELIIMARDTGHRVAKELWIQGYEKAMEIMVEDPLTGAKGWAYVFSFSKDIPMRSPISYIHYIPEIEGTVSEMWMHQEDPRHNGNT